MNFLPLPSKRRFGSEVCTQSVAAALNTLATPDDESVQKSLEWLLVVGTPHRHGKMYRLPGVARVIEWLCSSLFKTTDIERVDLSRMYGFKIWGDGLSDDADMRTSQLIERTRFRAIRNFLPTVTLAGHNMPIFQNVELDPLIGYIDD